MVWSYIKNRHGTQNRGERGAYKKINIVRKNALIIRKWMQLLEFGRGN